MMHKNLVEQDKPICEKLYRSYKWQFSLYVLEEE